MLEHLGLRVNRLIRTSYGPFVLGDLERGAVSEVPRRALREQLPARFKAALARDTGRHADRRR